MNLLLAILAGISLMIAVFSTVMMIRMASGSRRNSERDSESEERRIESLREAFRNELMMQNERFERRMQEEERRHELRNREMNEANARNFELLAAKTLDAQSERLRRLNDETLDSVLDPLRRKLDDFNRTVTDCYVRENASRQSLSDQLERLMKLNVTIGEEARQLTSALKGDSKIQGDWGEMILETLLENAGLTRGVNFLVQPTSDTSGKKLTDEEGHGLRPDVVILLPDKHRLIVDSKVSLTNYVRMTEATDEETSRMEGRRHLESVRRHIDELARKNYPAYFHGASEHTLMFIPNEGAYFAAMRLDSNLWKYAFDKRIVIVSPTHIFSTMQIVAQLWRQDKQNRNAAEIAKLGGLLYDKFALFLQDFQQIEQNISALSRSYNKSFDHLTKGGTSLASRAERLRNLGAKTSRKIPENLIEDNETLSASTSGHENRDQD